MACVCVSKGIVCTVLVLCVVGMLRKIIEI